MDIVSILLWIVFGALAGWIASLIMKTNREQGLLTDIIVGIVGAFIGGFIFNLFGATGVTGFNIGSLLVAIIGAVVLLAIVKAVRRA
ncbi:GlsB/YeaQ/YmgE family stress response membrane protein [Truepera radiovictrix]|uniref:Transglycosylase-associated protein n=1 Tax=Truepera radiovictrix (strain DSM 17093 / CIP 108686 / LMG 22925 / RQ-24) TaxID=649638 RepID=D7CQL1_TRURR|nr:GlsB/YeaQ/YmgE family stress response membrane protein [Truepera radiovictrix]ADI14995.1 Transglycosylase-associated protein [Truepera radiovictrix DSM 17093]WMT56450.1 GlsB/YeaQ/YmgE family stress response membrane protein [Truepera radiovictrix]